MRGILVVYLLVWVGVGVRGEKMIRHTLRDKSCALDNSFMACVQSCTQKESVETLWNSNLTDPGVREQVVGLLRGANLSGGEEDPFGCHVRCRTNPQRIICRADCSKDEEVDECFVPQKCDELDVRLSWGNKSCSECLTSFKITGTFCREEYPGRNQACFDLIETCATSVDPPTKEEFKECIELRQMEKDFEYFKKEDLVVEDKFLPCFRTNWNNDPPSSEGVVSPECDHHMSRYLSKALCYDFCDTESPPTNEFDVCVHACEPQDGECLLGCVLVHESPCVYKPDTTVVLTGFSNCQWLIDLALTNNPKEVTSSYFNEKVAYDQKDKLLHPNSHQFLQEVELDQGSKGYFVFPYFLIIRADCDGGYYDEAFYQLFMHGGSPSVEIQHWPSNPRDPFHANFKGIFRGALLSLNRNPGHILVPENHLKVQYSTDVGCHWEICYPGFAVPLFLYQIDSFEVTVDAQDVFDKLFQKIYVSAYNNRDIDGSGSIAVTDYLKNSKNIVTPQQFFPKATDRLSYSADSQLRDLEGCLSAKLNQGFCQAIIPREDDVVGFLPLDGEDFIMPQFTFGTAPSLVLAGFYDPSLLIIGDPDMNRFELIKWTLNDPAQNITIFWKNPIEGDLSRCLSGSIAGGFSKVMFTQMDTTDPLYPLNYYRVRMKPQHVAAGLPVEAIYEVISMEDRLLLVTSRGLSVFYGNTNATLKDNVLFKAPDEERLKKCFKFVRAGQRAGEESDLVIGVTYDYKTNSSINQEIHVGVMTNPGEKLKWTIVSRRDTGVDDVENAPPLDPNAGKVVTLDPRKHGGVPIRELEENAKSEVERICLKAYKENMEETQDAIIKDTTGWCVAIDAAPVFLRHNTFLILVRMLLYYVGKAASSANNRNVYFYVIASHTLGSSPEEPVEWDIVSIIPRVPCNEEHRQTVQNVPLYDQGYFVKEGGTKIGCQNINSENPQTHIYISRMVFTRMMSNQLFLFGNRLLQSADAGKTFVFLKGFGPETTGNDRRHRIEVMTFDEKGNYAFLTTKRELWVGSTGDIRQIQIRPSKGYSMTQTIVSSVKGLQDAVPFTVLYDHAGMLFEMVALVDGDGEVERIMKRRVPVNYVIRQLKFVDAMEDKGKEIGSSPKTCDPTDPSCSTAPAEYTYNPSKWEVYCPFSSPKLFENYSAIRSRNQLYFFPPPIQHSGFGRSYISSVLWAYQVATLSLTWKSVFKMQYDSYAKTRTDPDPFHRWVTEKEETSKIGLLKFIRGNKDEDGVLVLPAKYKRLSTNRSASNLFRFYYLDYNDVLQLTLSYSIKNDADLGTTDYTHQHISQIQLNVDNANGSLLTIDTEKVPQAQLASVRFIVRISVVRSDFLRQNLPGSHLISLHLVFHLIGGFGLCVPHASDTGTVNSLSTIIHIGCRPSTDILFNWNSTLHSIRFRDKDAHFGGKQGECYKNELVCFFARQPLKFFFDIYDITKQSYIPYTGNYVLRIVGGGYKKKDIVRYTEEEQEAYNIPGVSDVSLIWNEWDTEKGEKVDRKPVQFDAKAGDDIKKTNRETVLQAGVSAIQWACHTLSPCARIAPNIEFETIYWFRIFISNKGVDNNTLCLYEREFDIMLYGFPPSPETQLLTTIIFCLCVLGILFLLFICCRAHKRVWRATKVKMYGWYQIVKDTFPKSLKTHEEQGVEEGRTQQQKDNIILSLQGHLKIPPLVGRESAEVDSLPSSRRKTSMSEESRTSSITSIQSSTFSSVASQVLPPVVPRSDGTNWVDLVYEQIISKRLAAIIEKNKKLRSNILKRTSTHVHGLEQEKQYEKDHKKTIAEESVFTGEKDGEKDKKKEGKDK